MAWYQRFWNVLQPGRLETDLQRELEFHLTERAEEFQQAGMSEAGAARAARLQFGNFTTQMERTRDMDMAALLESMVRNLRYAVRGLPRTPAFTATVVLTLALGALRTQVVRQFLGRGLRVSALGCIAGLILAAASSRLLSGMLYGVSATDAATLGGVVIVVLAVSVAASLMPAIRAARVEPMQALRQE